MKSETNNSARKLYIFRTISNPRRCHRTQHICPQRKEIGFSVRKNLLFPCYTVFVFPSFLVLRVLFVSRIPILVTFEQEAKTLATPPSLARSQLSKGEGKSNFGGVTAVGAWLIMRFAQYDRSVVNSD